LFETFFLVTISYQLYVQIRRSSTGEGIVNFGTTQGAEISNQIKMIVNVWIQQASITATVMNEDLSTLKLSTVRYV
jgi:hypothetical protein